MLLEELSGEFYEASDRLPRILSSGGKILVRNEWDETDGNIFTTARRLRLTEYKGDYVVFCICERKNCKLDFVRECDYGHAGSNTVRSDRQFRMGNSDTDLVF